MKNVLSRLQTLKSSEDCDKYSKSVSYETLVGGTTTTGTGIKQTQKMFLGNAVKPLTAVGTLTSLLCNSAKVMENILQMSHVLRLIKIFGLVTVLSVGIISESRAEICEIGTTKVTCRSGIDILGKTEAGEYICGTDCTFTIVGDTVKVKANSDNATIDTGIFSPKAYSEGKVVKTNGEEVNFNKIELDGDFASIGNHAFAYSDATIVPKSGTLKISSNTTKIANYSTIQGDVYVEKAGGQTLPSADIKGNLIFADGIKTIGGWFMGSAKIDGDVVIPASVTSINADNWITLLDSLNKGHKVYCGAGNCYKLFYDSCYEDTRESYLSSCLKALKSLNDKGKLAGYNDECTDYKCQSCKSDYVYSKSGTGCVSDCGAGYLGKEGRCIDSALGCGENYRDMGGFCNRIQYTPAEAAKVLRNDNTNEVTITFRK